MVRINNSDLSNELRDVAKIQVGADIIPNILSNQVVPVIDVNPKHARNTNLVVSYKGDTFTVVTIATSNPNKDTYITALLLNTKFHTGGTATQTRITLVINGAEMTCINNVNFAGDGTTETAQITLRDPIKIDRNSLIRLRCDVAEAATACACIVMGYEVDNSNA